MQESKLTKTISNLRKELTSMESDSHSIVSSFKMLQQEAEYLKIDILMYSLKEQRKNIAYQRGLSRVMKNKRLLKTSLAVGIGGLILGGLITKDKYNSLNAGLSGFNGVVQGFGETRWAVFLHNKLLIVTPCDTISGKGTWVTFESLIAAISDLKKGVFRLKQPLTIDSIIKRLNRSKRLMYIAIPDRN